MEYRAGQTISCSRCGRRSRVTSVAGGNVTFELLDTGAFPGKCGSCGAVLCAACVQQAGDVCPKCGVRGKWMPLGQIACISTEGATARDRRTEIFEQTFAGDLAGVNAALAADRSLAGLRWDDGRTLLHAAVMSKSKDMVELMLRHKIDVSAVDENGQDALMYAVSLDLLEITKVLLQSGANPRARNNRGASAIVTAVLTGSPEILTALIDAGADIEQTGVVTLSSSSGTGYMTPTPLLIALYQGRGQAVEILLRAGADARARESASGWSALHFAVVALARNAGDITAGTLQRLLELGADAQARDGQGLTALDWARRTSRSEAIKVLEGVPKKKGWFW